ncbi:MAG: hypothetical protein KDD58_15085 [Bdellovibrionales bacterium]|nr:hypothetical protein [Bdellovibrionales bacterium]
MSRSKVEPINKLANEALKNLSQKQPRSKPTKDSYEILDQLNGQHPWQEVMPEGHLSYKVRELKNGKIAYFNFKLAKEMGILDKDHPDRLNKKLEEKLLSTFCVRIINEYDEQHKIRYPEDRIKEHPYMATRYLQLQHNNKKGETSGDGRCIWNGSVIHKGITWDVSSRGTGVTALAPGAVLAGKPLKSGNTEQGYGCGLAEIDELYSASIMAEIIHLQGIETERVLAIIDLGGGVGIGVRASQNLLRPAHLFMYLKQENYDALKRGTDYFILRQLHNKKWNFSFRSQNKYKLMLNEVNISFAKFVARLERDYIFAWLDWDGDNVLATAGIIDYGSVRQFGLRHDQYRYDDVERFSTNLNEQKAKARLIFQVFIQLVDYLETKERKGLNQFKDHPLLKDFDQVYEDEKRSLFLQQWGFSQKEVNALFANNYETVNTLFLEFEKLEKVKTKEKMSRVADGINRPAILNMRKFILIILQKLNKNFDEKISINEVYSEILSDDNCRTEDKQLSPYLESKINLVIENIKLLINSLGSKHRRTLFLQSLNARSQKWNKEERVTGNALLYIVNEIIENRSKGLKHEEIQKVIDNFIASQVTYSSELKPNTKNLNIARSKNLMRVVEEIAKSHNEDI